MADPIVITCSAACTVTLEHEIVVPPFNLTMEEAAEISLAILSVWALAWCIRQVVVFLRQSGASSTEEREP